MFHSCSPSPSCGLSHVRFTAEPSPRIPFTKCVVIMWSVHIPTWAQRRTSISATQQVRSATTANPHLQFGDTQWDHLWFSPCLSSCPGRAEFNVMLHSGSSSLSVVHSHSDCARHRATTSADWSPAGSLAETATLAETVPGSVQDSAGKLTPWLRRRSPCSRARERRSSSEQQYARVPNCLTQRQTTMPTRRRCADACSSGRASPD